MRLAYGRRTETLVQDRWDRTSRIIFWPGVRLMPAVQGFTLLELLVVIGVLSLLLSILLPALNRARSLAREAVCQSHLRQWGMVFTIYGHENQGYYPHCDGLDRQGDEPPATLADAADHCGWVDVLPPLWGERPWRDYPPWNHPEGDTFFQCPAAKLAPDNLYGYRPRRDGYFSYAMNACLELDENCWRHPEDTSGPMPSFLQSEKIECPAIVHLLFDQLLDPRLGYNGAHANRSAGAHCGSYPKAFSGRHARKEGELGGSILFCDGHVERQDSVWKPGWPDDLEVPPRTDANWYPYPP